MPSPYQKLPDTSGKPTKTSIHAAAILAFPTPYVPEHDPRTMAESTVLPMRRRAITAASKKIDTGADGSAIIGHRGRPAEWQNEVWAISKQVGELRYAANLFANGLSRLNLVLARKDRDSEETVRLADLKPAQLTKTDKIAMQIVSDLTSDQGMSEMQRVWGLNKFLVGEAMLVGIPETEVSRKKLLDYVWKMYSRADIVEKNGVLKICGEEFDPDTVLLIRVWQPDAQFYRMADSPVRSSLPILRELVGLTMHVSALIESRLAGAGILLLPTSATVLGSTPPEDDDEEDPTVAALIESMVTPIKDRDSAASIVPLVLTVPDESSDLIRHISFASPLEAAAKELRDEAIRRLALGVDMPPEQLLGLSTASHWTSWLLAEDTVRYQLVPGLKPLADALITELIRPILVEMGVDPLEALRYVFLTEADQLIQRPNKFDEAFELYKVDGITLAAVLAAGGFKQTDAPEKKAVEDRAVDLALKAVGINPSLYQDPGLLSLISQLRAALDGMDASNAPDTALPPSAQPTQANAPADLQPGPKENNTPDADRPNTPGPPRSSPSGPDKA